eukprot:gnl/MRDRNA2_/MRDRNA2_65131_c0_seq1.p1 gnl/MRDRNA2_/MRDRNA2_65131_c0~~gnl/MRDRNA2_/MRDRNA2_65131_c0_seq1.p1  ORF type:complete len:1036 (-),score=161.71 gnl/MRDRNA2_/MRDRNA2_65131_c0_seq1:33-3047(-)
MTAPMRQVSAASKTSSVMTTQANPGSAGQRTPAFSTSSSVGTPLMPQLATSSSQGMLPGAHTRISVAAPPNVVASRPFAVASSSIAANQSVTSSHFVNGTSASSGVLTQHSSSPVDRVVQYRDTLDEERLDEADEFKELLTIVSQIFSEIDTNGDGILEWNNGEIKSFARTLADSQGWQIATTWGEGEWYRLYRQFDKDGSYSLTTDECEQFAKHLYEVSGERTRFRHKLQRDRLTQLIVGLQSDIVINERLATMCVLNARKCFFQPLQIYSSKELLAASIGLWHALMKHAQDLRLLSEERRRFLLRTEQVAQRLSSLLRCTNSELDLMKIVDAWRCVTVDMRASKHVKTLEAEMYRFQAQLTLQDLASEAAFLHMRATNARDVALRKLFQGSQGELKQAVVSAWWNLFMLEATERFKLREQSVLQLIKIAEKQKKSGILEDWCSTDSAFVLQSALGAWKTVILKGRSHLAEIARLNGALGVLRWHVEAQTESLLRVIFNLWCKCVVGESLGRQFARLQAANAFLLEKCAEKVRWAMEACQRRNDSTLLKDVLVIWRKIASDAKHTSERDALACKIQRLQSQSMVHAAAALNSIFFEHGIGLCRIFLAGWRDIVAKLKAQKKYDSLEKDMNAMRAKAEAYKERALAALMSSSESLSIHMVFCEWCTIVRAARREKFLGGLHASNDALEDLRRQALIRASAHMFSWHHSSFTREAMDAWIVLYTDGLRARKKERQMDEADAKQAHKDLVLARAGYMLSEHASKFLMKHNFAAWHEFTVESRRERHEQYHLERKLRWRRRGGENMGQAIEGWCAGKDKHLRDKCFSSWVKLCISQRIVRERQRLQTEILFIRLDEENPSNIYLRFSLMRWGVGTSTYQWCLLVAWNSLALNTLRDLEIERLEHEKRLRETATRDAILYMLRPEVLAHWKLHFQAWWSIARDKVDERWINQNGWVSNKEQITIDFGDGALNFSSFFEGSPSKPKRPQPEHHNRHREHSPKHRHHVGH